MMNDYVRVLTGHSFTFAQSGNISPDTILRHLEQTLLAQMTVADRHNNGLPGDSDGFVKALPGKGLDASKHEVPAPRVTPQRL